MFTNFGLDSDPLEIANSRALMMCGTCGNPSAYHTNTYRNDQILSVCDYDFAANSPREDYDYFLHNAEGAITLYADFTGDSANILLMTEGVDFDNEDGTFTNYRIEDDPTYYVNTEEIEFATLSTWSDRNTNENTHALDWWYVTPTTIMSGAYSEDHKNRIERTPFNFNADRTAYVEGTAGFIARQYIDPNATERYHNRLLNSFINKRSGKFHVGSIAFDFNGSQVKATCVNPDCEVRCDDGQYRNRAITFDRTLINERSMMEAITYHIIKHGNNHGPSWLTSRPDFYLMHDFDCDLNHKGIACNHTRVVTDNLVTEMNDVEFVMDHQRYCSDRNCKCDEWLANEVPTLKEVA